VADRHRHRGLAAEVLAARTGRVADDPRCQIAATALLGLWRVQSTALRRSLDGERSPEQVRRAATVDVRSAARLVYAGLSEFAAGSR
jgi:hypothetical protein